MNNDVTRSVCIKPNINEKFLLGSNLLHQNTLMHCAVLAFIRAVKKG